MSTNTPTAFRQAWYRWKALKLPWRKRFLVGLDLEGNTFWEFRDTLSSHKHRMRRIVQYPPSTQYSEIKISPQWHQWLRHTRNDPPSLTEQSQDLVRQRNLKVLAAEADARWAAKPSFLDNPTRSQPLPAMNPKDSGGYSISGSTEEGNGASSPIIEINSSSATRDTIDVQEAQGDTFREGKTSADIPKPPEREQQQTSMPLAEQAEDPWKQARGGPSEEWQPKAWDGSFGAQKR